MYEYKAIITNIVDGDTFDMDIDLGFNIHIHERVRLLDVDTPEKFGEEKELGLLVKDYATRYFLNKEVIIKSEKEDIAADTDSFGRWLVKVNVDNKDICDIYNSLGVNKKCSTYDEYCVWDLEYKTSKYFEYNDWFEEDDLELIEEILEEINFSGVIDNLKIENVKYLLQELEDLHDVYEYKARRQSHNCEDAFHDYMFKCQDINKLIDYVKMFYKKHL